MAGTKRLVGFEHFSPDENIKVQEGLIETFTEYCFKVQKQTKMHTDSYNSTGSSK